jgi:hypothetical protein
MALMTQYERQKGMQSSFLPFFFWLVSLVCNTIPLYTAIMEKASSFRIQNKRLIETLWSVLTLSKKNSSIGHL